MLVLCGGVGGGLEPQLVQPGAAHLQLVHLHLQLSNVLELVRQLAVLALQLVQQVGVADCPQLGVPPEKRNLLKYYVHVVSATVAATTWFSS